MGKWQRSWFTAPMSGVSPGSRTYFTVVMCNITSWCNFKRQWGSELTWDMRNIRFLWFRHVSFKGPDALNMHKAGLTCNTFMIVHRQVTLWKAKHTAQIRGGKDLGTVWRKLSCFAPLCLKLKSPFCSNAVSEHSSSAAKGPFQEGRGLERPARWIFGPKTRPRT